MVFANFWFLIYTKHEIFVRVIQSRSTLSDDFKFSKGYKLIIQSNNKKMKKTATNKNETERWKEKPQKTKCNMMMNVTKRSPYRLQTCVPFLSWFIRGPTWLHVVKILLVWWFYYNLWCLGWCISVFFLYDTK